MILYHFTSSRHLRGIAKYGLTVGDVPTNLETFQGRIGVWLTSSPSSNGHGLEGSAVAKGDYRLSVLVDDQSPLLHRWLDWAQENVDPATLKALHISAAKTQNESANNYPPASWYVYFGVLSPERIMDCVFVETCESVKDWGNLSPRELDAPHVPPWRRNAWQRKMMKGVRRALKSASR